MSTEFSNGHPNESETERRKRAEALVRLIAYARDEALIMDAKFLAYCLEAAMAAAHELGDPSAAEAAELVAPSQPDPVELRLSQLH